MKKSVQFSLLLLAVVGIVGWELLNFVRVETQRVPQSVPSGASNLDSYDQLFPYSAELCAVTQWTKKGQPPGGETGHMFTILRGVCRDTSSPYPKIKMCDTSNTVGISVDLGFKNVNWVATEDADFVLTGGLPQNATLDQAAYDRALQHVLDEHVFQNVQFQERIIKNKPKGMSDERFIADYGLSTHYAVNFARNSYCARVPMNKQMMEKSVDFLNKKNHYYFVEKHEYVWDLVRDNCTTLAHNILAAAGVWSFKNPKGNILDSLNEAAIPANEFIGTVELNKLFDLTDVADLYQGTLLRPSFLDNRWLESQPGIMVRTVPIHSYDNQIFDVQSIIETIDYPLFDPLHSLFADDLKEPHYVDLKQNLLWYRDRYQHVLDSQREVSSYGRTRQDANLNSEVFRKFYSQYYDYIHSQIKWVDAALQKAQ
jgi:hypothetical protein